MSDRVYLPPDYSEYESPKEDDDELTCDLTDVTDEDEAEVERVLDEQALSNNKKKEMSNNSPFDWSNNSRSSERYPWENNTQTNSSTWGSNSWGGSSSGSWGSGWSSSNNNSTNSWGNNQTKPETNIGTSRTKSVIVCDVLDCLYESYSSNGKPNILPRGIFDLKPKFNVWDRISSFAPKKLYLIFPAPEIIPSFGNRESAEVTLEYISQSVTTYLRIPRANCFALKQMRNDTPKECQLGSAIKDWKRTDDMLYIGVHSGRYGLSSIDKDAAKLCGIDYIDLFNLIDGRYEFE